MSEMSSESSLSLVVLPTFPTQNAKIFSYFRTKVLIKSSDFGSKIQTGESASK
jgi:hypothetical protein